jgi:PPK2 family polyphosphate:nucleotide phosphotransferase
MKRLKLNPQHEVKIPITADERVEFRLKDILVPPGEKISLKKDYDPGFTGGFKDKTGALERVARNVDRLSNLQERLYAQDTYSLLIIFQAMDAAGKDGAIKHVMSGVNPQGCHVTSFKVPSAEELDHDYLWRSAKALPARGMIGIFNRSYYEETLVVRVHPELLAKQKLPQRKVDDKFWARRFREINAFERYLVRNGTVVLKFFLNLSKEEQRKRFISRIDEPQKNWKFSTQDYQERKHWDEYQHAIESMLNHTSTKQSPWIVVPADNKWFTRLAISEVICEVLESLQLKYPKLSDQQLAELQEIRKSLDSEK